MYPAPYDATELEELAEWVAGDLFRWRLRGIDIVEVGTDDPTGTVLVGVKNYAPVAGPIIQAVYPWLRIRAYQGVEGVLARPIRHGDPSGRRMPADKGTA